MEGSAGDAAAARGSGGELALVARGRVSLRAGPGRRGARFARAGGERSAARRRRAGVALVARAASWLGARGRTAAARAGAGWTIARSAVVSAAASSDAGWVAHRARFGVRGRGL